MTSLNEIKVQFQFFYWIDIHAIFDSMFLYLCFQFVKIIDSFMNKDGIKCLKFYYQDSVMPLLEGTNRNT